jgi:REP element-mobilizing transposase RayT
MDLPLRYHSSNLRRGRISLAQQAYLVTTRCAPGTRPFADFEVGCIAARTLAETRLWRGSRLLAWVLMPDHWHGLLELSGGESLSAAIGRAKAVSAGAVNRHGGARGALWQYGFHDRALRRDDDVVAVARYLIANPIRAGLVAVPGDYPFWDTVWPGVERELA